MMFGHYLQLSLLMMRAKPVRAILSLLGIYIGVLSLIVILSIRAGIEKQMDDLYRTQNAQVLLVFPGFDPVSRRIGQISEQDMIFLKELPDILSVTRRDNTEWTVTTEGTSSRARVTGMDSQFLSIYRIALLKGRSFLPDETERKSWVCIIQNSFAKKLFPHSNPIGAKLETQQGIFEIIGVVEMDDAAAMRTGLNDVDMWVSPVWVAASAQAAFVSCLEVRFKDSVNESQASAAVKSTLSRGHADRDSLYFIRTMDQMVKRNQDFSNRILSGLLGIAAISLLVGGIGIANVMITSVTERTREVGIRKALGARRADILTQFLVESVVLCGTGGVLAAVTGGIGVQLIPQLMSANVPLLFPFMPVMACVALTLVLGLVAGVYPATRAADLQPADALRYE